MYIRPLLASLSDGRTDTHDEASGCFSQFGERA